MIPHADHSAGVGDMRKKLLALVILVLGLGAGISLTVASPPFYTSSADVEVTSGGEWDAASLAILVTSQPVLDTAAHRLGQNQTAAELKDHLTVVHESLVFTVTAKDHDPGQAKAMASAVIGSFRHFLAGHDHVLKKGLPTHKRIRTIVLRPPRQGLAQRPLGAYLETAGLGFLGGVLLAFLIVRPSRRDVRRGYRAAFTLIFGRGRIAMNVLEVLDGPVIEVDHKAQRYTARNKRPVASHAGRV
jgi:hypothetical protein